MQKSHPKVVNPRDIAGERKKKNKKKKQTSLAHLDFQRTEIFNILQRVVCCTLLKVRLTGPIKATLTGLTFQRWFAEEQVPISQ